MLDESKSNIEEVDLIKDNVSTQSGVLFEISDDASPTILFLQQSGQVAPLTILRDKVKNVTILQYGEGENRVVIEVF